MAFDHKKIEAKWQQHWDEHQTFKTDGYDFSKPKYYALDMFPYPSGSGLHAGHPEGYTATDVICRMKRMQGFNVLHPMGFDLAYQQNSMQSRLVITQLHLQRKILRLSRNNCVHLVLVMIGIVRFLLQILLSITGHNGFSNVFLKMA